MASKTIEQSNSARKIGLTLMHTKGEIMQAALALPTSPQPVAANAGRQPADVTLLNLIAAGDEGARAQTGSAIYTVPLGAAASDDALIDAIADDDRHAFEVLYS